MKDDSFDYTGRDGVQILCRGSEGGPTNQHYCVLFLHRRQDQHVCPQEAGPSLYSWEVQVQALEVLQAKGRANSGHMFWGRSIVVT